jgi:hypothetical protein
VKTGLMQEVLDWLERLLASLESALETAIAYLPNVLVAFAVLFAGWLAARLARFVGVKAVERSEELLRQVRVAPPVEPGRARGGLAVLVGEVVYWIVLVGFLAGALQSLDLAVVDRWTRAFLDYLPAFVGGILIVLVGFVGGGLVRHVVTPAAASIGVANSELIGRLCQVSVVVIAVVIGTSELGIDVSFVVQLATVALGAVLAGLALAFALGTREHIANLVGTRYVRKRYRIGDRLQAGKFDGRILDISDGYVFLETADGDVSIPGRRFTGHAFIKLADESTDERG